MRNLSRLKSANRAMNRLWVALLILAVVGLTVFFWPQKEPEPAPIRVALMSSIPLQWGEADVAQMVQGKATAAEFYTRLSAGRSVQMIDDGTQLPKKQIDLLLLVQPRLLSPQEHVVLDAWVRKGGRVVIFADPALQWPSTFAVGDPRRPLFTSLLSPLLSHWGLELALPMEQEEGAVSSVVVGRQSIKTAAHGIWVNKLGDEDAACQISASMFLAQCRIGAGRAVLIADADMLDEALADSALLGGGQLDWSLALIDQVARNVALPAAYWDELES